MFDNPGIDHEDDIFRDVRGMVGNSFQAPTDDHHMDGSLDRSRIRNHKGEKFAKDLIV
jgi:hypothetical protein